MKSVDQIKSEIQKLQHIRPKVRKTNFFGHDNHAAINVQLAVLSAVSKLANLDELTSLPEADQFLRDDFDEMPPNVREAAQDAIDWASDYSDVESLADGDGWASIAK